MSATTLSDLAALAPETILAGMALVLIGVARRVRETQVAPIGTVLAALAAGAAVLWCTGQIGPGGDTTAFGGTILQDGYARFFQVLVAAALLLTAFLSGRGPSPDPSPRAEYHALLLLASTGMMLAVSSNDLLVLYLALEVTTLASCVLVGISVDRPASTEAAVKYLLAASFASALLLFGICLTYGTTGATDFPSIASAVAGKTPGADPIGVAAIALLVAGLAFKIAAVPFHAWAPDAYQGADVPVSAFLAAGSKAAGLAVLGRVCAVAFESHRTVLSPVLTALAAGSMVLGSLVLLTQSDLKRMLAYSSIAHVGYALLGLVAGTADGSAATMTYAFLYAFMTLGAFGVVAALGERGETVEGFRGLAARRPGTAAWMLLFLLSLTGIPPTAGFAAKFSVIASVVGTGQIALAVLAVACSVVSAFGYMRVAVLMYMGDAPEEDPPRIPAGAALAIATAAFVTLAGGVFPGLVVAWAVAP